MDPFNTTDTDITNLTKAGFTKDTSGIIGTDADSFGSFKANLNKGFDVGADVANNQANSGWDFSKMFDNSNNIGSTVGGIGTALSGAAAVYNAVQAKNYQDKLFSMEKDRVDKANARQTKAQADYDKSTGW